ncbi:MAG: carotenoid biosynthesis protein [Ilumatobacteraceae bacterium]|nr:carotenoid biosynthesis protein [Acidimicrobiia bacterium]
MSATTSTSAAVKVSRSAVLVALAAMVATPLFSRGGPERRALAYVVVGGFFLAALAAHWLVHHWRAVAASGVVMTVSLAIEVIGSRSGVPFGDYDYGAALQPKVFGVPLLVAVAWAMITLVVHGMFTKSSLSAFGQVVIGAAAITAWDVFLDPQMVGEGYWSWSQPGPAFRGIPLVNYGGWFVTAIVMLLLVRLILQANHSSHSGGTQMATTTQQLTFVIYSVLTVLSTIGFVFFFDDVVVAVTGLVAMGGSCVVALRSRSDQQSAETIA